MAATQDRLGKYEIRGTLGRGAMGTVLDGLDPVIERRVAIKTIPLAAEGEAAVEALARFRREAQAAGRLQHANLVAIYDYGETDTLAYIVMEHIDGPTLKSELGAQRRFTTDEIVHIMDGLLAGLAYCHERGVVHRDIKPANIMLTRDGDVKITDFGIARLESSQMTQVGTVMGTPAYMSPEQIMGQTVDFRTDLYSAGVVLYELLTGERPYDGSVSSILHKALHTEALPPSSLSVTAPRGLDCVVAQAMAKRPDERWSSARSFAHAIREAIAAPAPAAAEATLIVSAAARPGPAPSPRAAASPAAASAPPLASKPARLVPVIAAATGLLVLAGGGLFVLQRHTLAPAPRTLPPPPLPPAAAPSPQAVAPPAPLAKPAPAAPAIPPAEAAASLAGPIVSASPCTFAAARATASGVAVSGLSGRDAALRAALTDKLPGVALDWSVTAVPATYCGLLDTLRASTVPGELGLTLRGGQTVLTSGQLIMPQLRVPNTPSHVILDYFSNDGSLSHLYPRPGDRRAALSPGTLLSVGDKGAKAAQFPVAPPFGTDLILAIASPQELFARLRPADSDTVAAYLPALRRALEAAAARGGVTVQVMAVETRQR